MYSTVCISRHATSWPVIAYLNPWAPILYPPGHPPGERRLGSGLLPQIRRVSRGSGVPGTWGWVTWYGWTKLLRSRIFLKQSCLLFHDLFSQHTKRNANLRNLAMKSQIISEYQTSLCLKWKLKMAKQQVNPTSCHTHLSLPWPWVTTNHRFIRTAMTMIGVAKKMIWNDPWSKKHLRFHTPFPIPAA